MLAHLWAVLGVLVSVCEGVFREDAGVADFKLAVYGAPKFAAEQNGSLAVITEANVLAVYNEFGVTKWRQTLLPEQVSAGVGFAGDFVVVGGSYLELFNATSGLSLETINRPANSVCSVNNTVLVNSSSELTINGEFKPSNLSCAPIKVSNGTSVGPNLTLQITNNGVVSLHNATGQVWTREDGLYKATEAVFLHSPKPDAVDVPKGSAFKRAFKFVFKLVLGGGIPELLLPKKVPHEFQFDQVLVLRTELGSLYALNMTAQGSLQWVYHDLEAVKLVEQESRTEVCVLSLNGESYLVDNYGDIVATDCYSRSSLDIKVNGTTLTPESKLWELELPGTQLVGRGLKDPREVTQRVAVPLNDYEVLYKYLNPYTEVFTTLNNETSELAVTVVCRVTGRVLAQALHPTKVVVSPNLPFSLVVSDYWFAYTVAGIGADGELVPQIVVGELYESYLPNTRFSSSVVKVSEPQPLPYLSLRQWSVPNDEVCYSLAVSRTKHGASARSLVLALENKVVAISRAQLNTLNGPPALKLEQNGFLSHIYGVHRARHLKASDTNMESTYLLAAFGTPDLFVTRSAPTTGFDYLPRTFPKMQQALMIGSLAFGCHWLGSKARARVLARAWA